MDIRWHLAYLLSTRQVSEFMDVSGVRVAHSTISRWASNTASSWKPHSPGANARCGQVSG